MEKAPRGYMRTFSMLSRLLKRVHTLIFGFLLFFSDLFSILIVLSWVWRLAQWKRKKENIFKFCREPENQIWFKLLRNCLRKFKIPNSIQLSNEVIGHRSIVIVSSGAHATKDLQCFLPFFASYSLPSRPVFVGFSQNTSLR
jgi:hypothetical protein